MQSIDRYLDLIIFLHVICNLFCTFQRMFKGVTSLLQQRANEVRAQPVNWTAYVSGCLISQEEYDFMTKLESMNASDRERLFADSKARVDAARTLLGLLAHVHNQQLLQHILIRIDDLLNEQKSRAHVFYEVTSSRRHESMYQPFFALLTREDEFVQQLTARLLAKLAIWSGQPLAGSDLVYFLSWLRDHLKPGGEYVQNTTRCLQLLLREANYRAAFVACEGLKALTVVLSAKSNFQLQYQLVFCVWLISFSGELASKLSNQNLVPVLADILAESVKEKVIRIVLATFRNLLEKPVDTELIRDHAITMVHCKVPKQLDIFQQSGAKFDDEDLREDIDYLAGQLHAYVLDLSSFDEYTNELRSGRLEWSPVHSSEKFWRENAHRLNERNYELLKILVKLLETSRDNLVLSVAAHDIGEYVRHYPRGKAVAENLGAKQLVMQLLTHQEPHVKYEALLCLQKLMVHNWEYLGKKLENETNLGKDTKASSTRA